MYNDTEFCVGICFVRWLNPLRGGKEYWMWTETFRIAYSWKCTLTNKKNQ